MNKTRFLVCLAFGSLVGTLQANVKLPSLFGNNMVLQQEQAASLWGTADPGEKVTVEVAAQKGEAVAGTDGKWKVKLPPLPPQKDPVKVTVSGKNTITLNNVLIGEVWVGAGQSNMQWSLSDTKDGAVEIPRAANPKIRLFTVKRRSSPTPLADPDGIWVECSPNSASKFSAVLYYFGRDLHKQLGRPVGLISCCWSATIIQSWSRWESLISDPESKAEAEPLIAQLDNNQKREEEKAKYEKDLAAAKAAGTKPPMRPISMIRKADWRNRPSGLFTGMLHTILGLPVRGVLWYQGEFNVHNTAQYSRLLPMMISDWRQQWGIGDFPFFIVQLPQNGPAQTEPSSSDQTWPLMREVQAKTVAKVPNTGFAVTIDTAEDGNIHPTNKEPVGQRLALLVNDQVYANKNVAGRSPLFASSTKEGNGFRIKFSHAEGGLVTKNNGPVQGFAIAGADKKFVWAEAKISGDSVLVSSPQITEPVAVRYGWANHPITSLYNQAGLPAAPFRTDDWN